MKPAILVILLLALFLVYNLRWGYESYEVVNPTKQSIYEYKRKWPNGQYQSMILRVKGELKGGTAIVKVYQYRKDPSTAYEILKLRIQGKVDTVISAQFYKGEASILYKPRGVEGGTLDIDIAAR